MQAGDIFFQIKKIKVFYYRTIRVAIARIVAKLMKKTHMENNAIRGGARPLY
jgi:hypothetical protein